jgi:EAL domain-containing protein (putative c-di-GMP-specific phosphodiesterase class I)
VETQAQLQALARLGCDDFQGFLFGRPAPAAEASALPALARAWPSPAPPALGPARLRGAG